MTMTTPTEIDPASFPLRAMKIVMLAMTVVLICVSVAVVLIAQEASRTQDNADAQRRANEDLRSELQCRAVPQLDYDREASELDAMIAEGLASIALGEFDDPEAFAAALHAQVDVVNETLRSRESSLIDCAK